MRDEAIMHNSAQNIIITGASGGLGRALALYHAQAGAAFDLWGRSPARLKEVCEAVEARGAKAKRTCHDLSDTAGAIEILIKQDRAASFDVAYLVAGIGDVRPEGAMVEPPELVLRAAQINFTAPAAMAAALAARMAERGHGRIVLIGSAAAHHSLPFAAAYSGSKAGLARFADGLRLAVKPHGVSVTLAAPGFIDTSAARAISSNRPFELTAAEAARRIADAAERKARHFVTPWPFVLFQTLDRLLPMALRDHILTRLKP